MGLNINQRALLLKLIKYSVDKSLYFIFKTLITWLYYVKPILLIFLWQNSYLSFKQYLEKTNFFLN